MDKNIYSKIDTKRKIIILNLQDLDMLKKISKILKGNSRNVEIFSVIYCDYFYGLDNLNIISEREMKEIVNAYHLYEFTDKVIFLSRFSSYSSLTNYVQQGIMTEDEMLEVLFQDIW